MEVGAAVLSVGICFMSVILILTLIVFIWFSGLLDNVSVSAGPPPCGSLKVMYKYGRGPYKNVGAFFTEVTSIDPKRKCFGVYYDDPNQVSNERLRWAVGCILSETDEDLDLNVLKMFEAEGYKYYQFPEVNNAVRTSFPYRSSISVLVGVYRAYPEMASYIRRMKLCAHPFLEVYAGDVIHCYAPLSKQEYFYVPETDRDYVDPRLMEHSTVPTNTMIQGDTGEGCSKEAPSRQASDGEGSSNAEAQSMPDIAIVASKGNVLPPESPGCNSLEEPPDQAVTKACTPKRQTSSQRVPELTRTRESQSRASAKLQTQTLVDQYPSVVPEKPNSSVQMKTNIRMSEPPEQTHKPSEARSRSVSVQNATVPTEETGSSRLVDNTGLMAMDAVDIVQDSGVTSTVRETSVISSDGADSFSDLERSPANSYSVTSATSYGSSDQSSGVSQSLSASRSDSQSFSGSSYSDVSPGVFSQSSGLTADNNTALIELSSDSDGEMSSVLQSTNAGST